MAIYLDQTSETHKNTWNAMFCKLYPRTPATVETEIKLLKCGDFEISKDLREGRHDNLEHISTLHKNTKNLILYRIPADFLQLKAKIPHGDPATPAAIQRRN